MEKCTCGADRKLFWLWRDSNEELHASRFAPSHGGVRAVYAATARDALLSGLQGKAPKHSVVDSQDASMMWAGRCASQVTS